MVQSSSLAFCRYFPKRPRGKRVVISEAGQQDGATSERQADVLCSDG